MIIGITESGDPSIDFSWTSKVDNCDGVILITKNVSDKLISQIMKYIDKIILHASQLFYTCGLQNKIVRIFTSFSPHTFLTCFLSLLKNYQYMGVCHFHFLS